ncbi:hypothetical protein Tco_0080302 [Tanacetum coccineum]
MQKSKSYRAAQEHRDLYDALVKSYMLDKDLFESYGKSYSLKRDHEDKDKDEDPPAGSDKWLKRKKTSKDAEPSKSSKSKESKSSSSKGTKSQPKSSSKSVQAEESVFESAEIEMPQNQGSDLGNTDDQPNIEATSKHDWFKKPKRPLTPDLDWNANKTIDFRPPQTWISKIAKAKKTPLTFNELMSTPIDFSVYVMNNVKIDNLTQENLVRPDFNLLKGTCKSQMELEYHFEECYKAVTDRLNWNNPERQEYPFDLSKPLPLIKDQGHQVVPVNYLINNDLEYLKGVEDMVLWLWSPVKYDYGYLEEIVVRREDQKLYKFKEGDFPRLNLRDIEDMLLLLVQKKIANLENDVIFNLNVALWMFTKRVVILKRVEDLQLGVKSYQKKLNITRPETFRSDISKRTPYTAYNSPQGIIYVDQFKRNRLICSDEPYKFSDGTLTSIRSVLHDISSNLRMDYLPKRRWSTLDKQRSRIMIKSIDKLQLERRLMRNLEKFVDGREYREDFRLLERIILLCHILPYSISGKINGEKKEALLTLRQKLGQYINYHKHKLLSGIEDSLHRPSDAIHNPPQPLKVWRYVRSLADMDSIQPNLHDIVSYLQPMNVRRSPEEIRDLIMVTVRLKLVSFCFKNTTNVNRLLARWKLPRNFRLYGI